MAREPLIVCPPLFPSEADAAWEICGGFKLVDIGGATLGEVALPWTEEFIRAVFGACDPDDGRRYINEFFLMVSKKNAKSTIAAAIMLCALIMNWRPSAELLILSPTKEIADNSYKPIRDMIKADDELAAMLKVQDYFRTVTHLENGSTLKVVAADSDTVSGKKASFVFVDELHEFGKQVKASNMLLEATGGLTSRPEGFVIYATTQSAEPPAGVFKEKLSYARRVRDGEIKDKRFLPLIYEFPDEMLAAKAYEDLSNAYVTNPNWGASVDIARIEQLHSQVLEGGEQALKEFRAKHLNVEIGLNLRSDRWAGADYWETQTIAEGLTLPELLDRCEVATVGIDGGGLDDLFGLCVLGRERGTSRWLAWFKAWAHPSVLERRKSEASRFRDFEKDGDLVIVGRVRDDIEEVAEIVATVAKSGLLDRNGQDKAAIGVDTSGLGDTLDALSEVGINLDQVTGISQGWRLMTAIQTTERRLAGEELWHAGTPMLAWCVGNAKTVPKGNAVMIDKQVSGRGKIDPLMALFNAVELMSRNPASCVSVYEGRGVLTA